MSGSKNYGIFAQWNTTQQKKGASTLHTVWMDLESIMLNEVSQEVKDKYHL